MTIGKWLVSRPGRAGQGARQSHNTSMSYRKTSHAVYDLKYHLVWITK